MSVDLSRFISAHERDFERALLEIKMGRKQSHWMWYIFPQLKGLGKSTTSDFYGISNVDEARAFYEHPVLGRNLIEITTALLRLDNNDIVAILGRPDNLKLKSSMTLFEASVKDNVIFVNVLIKFFDGKRDQHTLKMIKKQ